MLTNTHQHISQAGVDNSSTRILPAGTVCLSRTASVGYVVTMGVPMCTSQDFINWVCGPDLNNRYLHYVLMLESDSIRENFAFGTTHRTMYYPDAKALHVLLPPLPEQQAIAEVLGALDDKIAANSKLVSTANDLANAAFQRTRRTEVLSTSAYSDVAAIGGGATPDTKNPGYWDGDVHWAAPSDVTALSAPYLEDTPRRITAAGLQACSSPLYPAGSILMTSRATIGAMAIAEEPTAVNQGFIVVQPKNPDAQWWLFHEMQQRVPDYLSQANGATFLELPRKVFRALEVQLPNSQALARFQQAAGALHSRARSANRESRTLASLRDTLLPALMSGKLRVRDAIATAEEVL